MEALCLVISSSPLACWRFSAPFSSERSCTTAGRSGRRNNSACAGTSEALASGAGVIDGATHYFGYRLGEAHVLTATAARALAIEIEARAGPPVGDGAPGSDQPAGSLPPYRLRKVTHYVRRHLGEPITVAQLAAEARMSSAHFARLFKQTLDQTPMQYVAACRVEEAKRRLLTTELKVEEIARQVGLRSASHFAEVFRRHVGMTPRAYRNRHRT